MNTNTCRPKARRHPRRRNGFFAPSIENIFNEVMNTSLKDIAQDDSPHFSKPQANIMKSESGFTLELALPGLSKKDVEIKVDKDTLIISSAKEAEGDVNFRLREFNYGTFERRFRLNETIDKNTIKASFKNGVLTISMENAKVEPAKTISIK